MTALIPCSCKCAQAGIQPQAQSPLTELHACIGEAASVRYIAKAAGGELEGILRSCAGLDPTTDKPAEEPGQNTKNNVALSLLRLRRALCGAYSIRYTFEPYGKDPDVTELCIWVRWVFGADEECVRTGILRNDRTRTVTTVDGTGAMGIGYDYNFSFDTFSAASDPWQRNFGFCKLYDRAAFLIGDRYETIRVPFRYGGKDWMIQIWKGIYSWNMIGGEIGIYTKPTDRKTPFYDCAADPDRLEMSFTVAHGDETIVRTQHSLSWWQTTFTVHKSLAPSSLTMCFDIVFPNAEMLHAFAAALADSAPQVQVRRSGLRVTCRWSGDA